MQHYIHKIEHQGETLTFVRNIRVTADMAGAIGAKSYNEFRATIFSAVDDLLIMAKLAEAAIVGNGYPATLLQELQDDQAHSLVLQLVLDGKLEDVLSSMREAQRTGVKKLMKKPTRSKAKKLTKT